VALAEHEANDAAPGKLLDAGDDSGRVEALEAQTHTRNVDHEEEEEASP
jgi:hypothetical protein